jgi:HAD superfamily phosphoserine phosphatase-like hydrolase
MVEVDFLIHNSEIIAFDFCKTLVNKQTADDFLIYCIQNTPREKIYLVLRKFVGVFRKSINEKKFLLFFLFGLSLKKIQTKGAEYAKQLKDNFSNDQLDSFMKLACSSNKEIYIISGGFDYYIRPYSDFYDYKIKVLSNEMRFLFGLCLGVIYGKDCMRDEKVKRLHKLNVDLSNFIFFSDCISDLPLLKISKSAIVVSENNSQAWVKNFNFVEIILNH